MTDKSVEAIVDELYRADLEEFTQRRNAAVKQLRAAGEREAADEVQALTKPTISAWAINQLARDRRKQIDELLHVGHRLRQAQGELMRGSGGERFGGARAQHAAAVKRLVSEAEQLLRDRKGSASSSALERVASTLQAASLSDDGRELLARGRLTRDVEPAGFEALARLAPARPPPRRAAPPRGGAPQRQSARERERLEQQLEEARKEERRLGEEARAAEKEAREARRQAASLERRYAQLRKREERAAARAAELEARLAQFTPRPQGGSDDG